MRRGLAWDAPGSRAGFRMNVFAGALVLYLFLVAELGILLWRGIPVPWREVVFNLNSGHVVMWTCRGLEVLAYAAIVRYAPIHLEGSVAPWLLWGIAFVAWDFCFYWLHRLHHAVPLLWKVHVVHHQGEHYGLSLGVRNSWYSSLTSLPFFVPMALAGVPVEYFVGIGTIHYFVQFWNHNALVRSQGILERFCVTPSHHRVHHGANPEYIDRNFGGTLLLWDRLFGTFQPMRSDIEIRYGVDGMPLGTDPWTENQRPFRGWKPTGIRAGSASRVVPGDLWRIGAPGLFVFALLLHYVARSPGWGVAERIGYGTTLMALTLGLGAISEERPGGRNLWLVLSAAVLGMWAYRFQDPWLAALWIPLAVHAVWAKVKG